MRRLRAIDLIFVVVCLVIALLGPIGQVLANLTG